ncbi:MAG: RnfABCDGE type electron transport complex subunit B [Lachnospiraceae bacterium]|nr:RnfABCDGE type electron transport complex subunit B [Lachnospiraceae bacterium]
MLAAAVVGGVGLFVAVFLGIAAIKFHVDVDEREVRVLELLPGYNCGGCGYAGCSGLAAAIAKGEAAVDGCTAGGEAVAKEVAAVMGVEVTASERMTAFVRCAGDCEKAGTDYTYTGVEDCSMIAFVPGGGPKTCNYGCLGYGACVKACPFDAIHVIDGVAVVDKEACKACGKCVKACPKGLIELIPYKSRYAVACSSKDKGPVTMKACQVGCIGCSLCVKNCPKDAVTVENFLSRIDQDKCEQCGACASKCPKKTIVEL